MRHLAPISGCRLRRGLSVPETPVQAYRDFYEIPGRLQNFPHPCGVNGLRGSGITSNQRSCRPATLLRTLKLSGICFTRNEMKRHLVENRLEESRRKHECL